MLISVNPFKQMPYFTDREIELYQGAVRLLHAGWRGHQGFLGLNLVQKTRGCSMSVPTLPSPLDAAGVNTPKGADGESVTGLRSQVTFLGNSAHKYTPKQPKDGKIQPEC